MSPSPTKESAMANLFRRIFRSYRNFPVSPGHAVLRRLFRALLQRHQLVRLRNGIRLEIDLDSVVQHTLFWLDGDMEPQLEWVIRELLPPGGNCVDCGANCGYVGLLAKRLRNARVLFIEPHPRLARTVRNNIALNGWSENCRLIETAASDHDGEASLFESAEYDGSHSLLADWVPGQSAPAEIKVRIRTLPSLLTNESGFGHVDLMKIDTEGHDFAVLRGMGPWLRPENVKVIYAELGRNRAESIALLEQAGYSGFSYRQLPRKKIRKMMIRYGDGQPIAMFQPLVRTPGFEGETLWVGRRSEAARYLEALVADPSAVLE